MDKYKTFGPRFWAGFIDGLVFLPISLFDSYLSSPARGPMVLISWAIVSYSSYWLYSVSLHARYGQTLGKRAMHVRVMDVSEERIPSLRQAFLRDAGYIALSTSSLIYFILCCCCSRVRHWHRTSEQSAGNGPRVRRPWMVPA